MKFRKYMRRKQRYIAGLTPENIYARQRGAAWMCAVIERRIPMDSYFFTYLCWVLGSKSQIFDYLIEDMGSAKSGRTFQKDIKDLTEIIMEEPYRMEDKLEEFLGKYPTAAKPFGTYIYTLCEKFAQDKVQGKPVYGLAMACLRDVFGISQTAAEICEYIFLKQEFEAIESYFEDHLRIHTHAGRRTFLQMLGISSVAFSEALGELKKSGLIESSSSCLSLSDGLEQFWEPGANKDVAGNFCKPLRGEALPLASFNIPKAELKYTLGLLKGKGQAPVHIMLYGHPGTGKTTFVRSLAQHLDVKAWAVPANEKEGDADRRTALTACLHTASRHPGAFVLVDEAERLLDSNPFASSDGYGKAWINELLERPGLRVIWVTNHINHIDQAVRRRFSYSIHFAKLGKRERVNIWAQILERHNIQFFETSELEALASEYEVEAGVIEAAVRQAKRLARGRKTAFVGALEQHLKSYLKLRSNGHQRKRKPETVEHYSEDGVCLDGSVQDLMSACRRADAAMRANKTIPQGAATMLFYGPPGTGKTALSRHIAQELGRECHIKKASDILDKYVGESEQHIASAFARAEEEGAVLVFDEADSFIYSRAEANHSWERTLVNEFLTNLEGCRCFCICTSNLRESMDSAAMRRFARKVAFTYAGPEQVAALYDSLLAPLAHEELTPDLKRRLMGLPRLAPGDFRTVRLQYSSFFGEIKVPSHEELIMALAKEQEMKLEKGGRKIGF